MRTIRRLYVYLVAFISLEVVIWGVTGLVRSMVGGKLVGSEANQLASALSLIAVGVPVFLLHWWLVQRTTTDDEEHFARLRALFLYGTLLATLIPMVQNTLALLNRIWLLIFQLPTRLAFVGEGQSWVDNIIALVMNGIIALYIYSVLQKDWAAISQKISPKESNFPETRRLYRYIWVIYGLAMVVGGIQQVLYFILRLTGTIGQGTGASPANGLTLIIVGTPLWFYSWRNVHQSLLDRDERRSILRLIILYALSLIGVGGVLIPIGMVLEVLTRLILGESMTFSQLLTEISNPLSAAIAFGGVWAYYGRTLTREVSALPDTIRRASLRRFYFYILSFVGLVTTFLGLNALLSFIIDVLLQTTTWAVTLRSHLSAALSTLMLGLPLWMITWRLIVKEASQKGETGDHARRSLIRKVYLYLALFAGVIGIMVTAGSLIYQLLSKLLGTPPENFQRASWMLLEMLVLFAIVLIYHWTTLRSDGHLAEQTLAALHKAFPVLVLVSETDIFSEEILKFLHREVPSLPVAIHTIDSGVPDETLSKAKAVILNGDISANPSEAIRIWLQGFTGTRLVIPTKTDRWLWTYGSGRNLSTLAQQTAKMVRHLAEGEEPPTIRESSPWTVALYIVAGVIGIPLIIGLFSILSDILY
jgi:hypothetical protein